MKSEDVCFLAGKLCQTSMVCWKADVTLPTKVHIVKAMVFPVVIYCESWTIKKHWRIDAFQLLEKTPESPLDRKEIKPVNLQGNQTLNTHWKNWCWSWNSNILVIWCKPLTHWKVPDAGKDWGQKKKRASEDEMAGWHHRCNGNKLGQTSGDGKGQRGLVCYSPWGHKESDTTGWLNNNNSSNIFRNNSYMMIKWILSQECKVGLTFKYQSMQFNMLTTQKRKNIIISIDPERLVENYSQ